MPVIRKKCVNDEQFTYTGKEASPMGLGHTAVKYVVGDRMKGRDDTMWMVSKKNDVNVWVRVPTESLTKDAPVIPSDEDAHPTAETEPEDKPKPAPKATKTKAKKLAQPDPEQADAKKSVVNKKQEPPAEAEEAVVVADVQEAEKPEPEPEIKKKPAKKKTEAKVAAEAEKPEPEPKKKPAKKTAKKEEAEAQADAEPDGAVKKAVAKPKKVSDYNLFVKLQTELAKVDPATKDMDGKTRFKYVSQRASELWKTMDDAAKAAAVAHMK